jgi:hypothetical protein
MPFIDETSDYLRANGSVKEPFKNDEEYSQEENDNRDFVDAMHHFNIDIARPRSVLFSKEIASHFSHAEEITNSTLLLFAFHGIN